MKEVYKLKSKVWLTIDIEEIDDSNFNINWHNKPDLDYHNIIENWIALCDKMGVKSTCFILGSFALKHPELVLNLYNNGHEIASHGLDHSLVHKQQFEDWVYSIRESKRIIEEIIDDKIFGYRSASWSLPFEKKYYDELVKNGYVYSSSYFPFKTYMYGNTIDKKEPFEITTKSGTISEYPVLKNRTPYSGGFYLRVLPLFVCKYLFQNSIKKGLKPIVYIHPYELLNVNLINYFRNFFNINLDFILAFYSTSRPIKKIEKLLK